MFAKPVHSLITNFSGISEVGCSQLTYEYLFWNLKKKWKKKKKKAFMCSALSWEQILVV